MNTKQGGIMLNKKGRPLRTYIILGSVFVYIPDRLR